MSNFKGDLVEAAGVEAASVIAGCGSAMLWGNKGVTLSNQQWMGL